VTIIAILSKRTSQIPEAIRTVAEASLTENLLSIYVETRGRLDQEPDWLPGPSEDDPWRYRLSSYEIPRVQQFIILTDERGHTLRRD
jgi:hypothetical protein